MHEDLIGYLLGALEPHEMRRVAQWLEDDPAARQELEAIEKLLRPLEQTYEPPKSPPQDLIAKTLAALPPVPSQSVSKSEVHMEDERADVGSCDLVDLPKLEPSLGNAGGRGYGWTDWLGAAAAAVVMLTVIIPALAAGRLEARKTACQDHLRQFGTAITQYVSHSPQERMPAVAETGREAFAGVFMIRLNEAGLLTDPDLRWCPSLDQPPNIEAALTDLASVPSLDDIHDAPVDRLRQMQQYAGGQYAYNLGVIEEDRLKSPRFESRASFAVMSDAPLPGITGTTQHGKLVGHNGTGINVLYEDGRVRFIPLAALETMPDHPLLNHRGEVEAGVSVDDATLAPSWRPPFVNVRQR
ncbi:MAG: hypothetical protein L7W43_15515 [Rubripirellula sp.]|nr:hypothetical protein [Rubripirellula sp.]